ncbi:hypothetical protein NPIL_490091 [Nephila pilipes]|uniref:Uncharacterized protein n=1 Tax=Nephila pilipes TaxID=299642 RepID=A0A8X6PE24_NEPPI|nr:hypothetical protein NPIL_490091 [Nephila pilipes]
MDEDETFLHVEGLFTLDTCWGYGYGPARKSYSLPWIRRGLQKDSGHTGETRCAYVNKSLFTHDSFSVTTS